MLVATLLLIPRLNCDITYFPGKYLWAEDGSIFINEAQTMGIASIWNSYAGYLHVYPRLIAVIANNLGLIYAPTIFLIGWFIAYLFMFYVLLNAAKSLQVDFITALFLTILIALQPNNGEAFFNLTNAQWLTGTALILLLLTHTNERFSFSISKLILILVLGLTGPFSLIIIPILVLKLIMLHDFKKNYWIYLVTLGGASIQLAFLIKSPRIALENINNVPWDWFLSFFQLTLFSVNSIATMIAVLLFWALFISLICNKTANANNKLIGLLLLTASLLILSSLYLIKQGPLALATWSMGRGHRYTWIPYTLIFFAFALAQDKKRIRQSLMFGLALFICYQNFRSILRLEVNLQFQSFVNFSKYIDVIIPIHPQWPRFPGWHINTTSLNLNKSQLENIKQINLNLHDFSALNAKIEILNKMLHVDSNGVNPSLLYANPVICNAVDIGIEIVLNRNKEGWIQVFWDGNKQFLETKSLRRWYPSGEITAQFAFPNEKDGVFIRFDPIDSVGMSDIKAFKIFCLP